MEDFSLRDKNKSAYKLKDFGPVYCINLDGQPDRWQYMENQFKYWEITNYTRISAYDGREDDLSGICLLYTSPSPRDRQKSRMPSSA